VSASPASYWGLRARDLLAGRSFNGQAPAEAFDPALYAPRGTQAEAEAWLSAWAGPPPDGRTATDLPASLTGLDAFQRALGLQHLGQVGTAGVEFRQVLATEQKDPWALYALSLYCRDRRFYQPSITCAERVLAMAPDAARESAPRLLAELAYPTYYADLVLAEGRPSNTDPLLFFALMRQESLFDHAATSRSDARGLTQVIPSTGSYIAGKLADASYTPERLWWPAVSMHYGMWYFSSALSMFQDDALAALVGYNAGPGNASKWAKLADGDQDLFFECVTLAEPRAYMRRIYEHRAHYEQLYR
jgi:soluble lytic murein transglycosylase